MGDLDTFANISKHRRMLPDDIPRADGGEANGARDAFASVAFTAVDRAVLEIFVQRSGDRFAHRQRGA